MKRLLVATTIIVILLIPLSVQGDTTFLDSYTLNIPNHTIYKKTDTSSTPSNAPSYKINNIYFSLKNKIITAKIGLAGTPVLNSSIKYYFDITFTVNASYYIELVFSRGVSNSNQSIYTQISTPTIDTSSLSYATYKSKHLDNISTQVINHDIIWQLNISNTYNAFNLENYMVKNTLINKFKNPYSPGINIYVKNSYNISGTIITIGDTYNLSPGTNTVAIALQHYFIYSIIFVIVIFILFLVRRRFLEKQRRNKFKEELRSGKYDHWLKRN